MATVHSKSTKKLVKEDELMIFLSKAEEWFEQYWRIVAYSAAGIIVVVIVFWVMAVSRANANRDAGYDLADARKYLATGDYAQATDKLKALIAHRKGTDIAEEAELTLGRVKLIEGKNDEASQYFQQFLKEHPHDGVRSIGAANGIAVTLESKGKLAEAYAQYRKVYEMDKTGIAAPQALLDAARVALDLNDYANAKDNALTLVQQFPLSTVRSQADDILNRTGR